jgi:hypothetical protein
MSQDVYRNLAPPSSGLFLEVSFRRLLDSCFEIMSGDTKHRRDLKNWRTSPVFHHVRFQLSPGNPLIGIFFESA